MRLSEAIRLGATLHPQTFYSLFGLIGTHTCAMGTCATGAALVAMGIGPTRNTFLMNLDVHLRSLWPWTFNTSVECPECPEKALSVYIITHLNDTHRWTREAIADWVATVEPVPEPVEMTVEAVEPEMAVLA